MLNSKGKTKEGGGVLVAVSKNINSTRLLSAESNDHEDLWVRLDLNNGQTITLCVIYLPSPLNKNTLITFIDHFNEISESLDSLFLVGDFNLSSIDWPCINSSNNNAKPNSNGSPVAETLIDFVSLNNLTQYNGVLNKQNKILDLVLSDISGVTVTRCLRSLSKVDGYHPPLHISVEGSVARELKSNDKTTKYNYFKADYTLITAELDKIDWVRELQNCLDVDEMVGVFYSHLYFIIDKIVPKTRLKNNKYPSWFSKDLIRRLKEKHKLLQKYKIHKNPRDEISLLILSNHCASLTTRCYKTYIKRIEYSISKNPKYFWTYIKSKKNTESHYPSKMTYSNQVSTDGKEICNMFGEYFSSVFSKPLIGNFNQQRGDVRCSDVCSFTITSLTQKEIFRYLKRLDVTKGACPDGIPPVFIVNCASSLALPLNIIFNKSLSSGAFPLKWKKAKIVPIHKKGDLEQVTNYRPISLLSTLAKVFEALICPYLHSHMKQMLTGSQHGFVQARSTSTNLVTFINTVVEAVDTQKQVDAIYTDFSKAFDRVCHNTLLLKLSNYGFGGPMLLWLGSYLADRSQYVVIRGFQSDSFPVLSGVPQGSHIGPLLFNIFVNDMIDVIKYSKVYLYADDLKLVKVIGEIQDSAHLQSDVDSLSEWSVRNNMSLNVDKCFHIKFTRKHNMLQTCYYINGKCLEEVSKLRDLGILVDTKLTFIPHIDDVVSRASRMLGFIIRNGKVFQSPQTKILLFNSYVRSFLEYGSVVWSPQYSVHGLRIERIQKRFLRHLAFASGKLRMLPSYTDKLQNFNVCTLKARRQLLDMTFLFKVFNNHIDCPELLNLFKLRVPRKPPRYPSVLFSAPLARTNLRSHNAVSRLSYLYNSLGESVDIFGESLSAFKNKVLELVNDA